MSRTTLTQVGTYLEPSLVAEMDRLRGDIPRSKILEKALMRYLNQVKKGEARLLPAIEMMEVQNKA
jgi:hypothetical protein